MSDLFTEKKIQPMLIGVEGDPFDDSAFIYELKVDGERCIAYLDPEHGTELRNKRNLRMLPKVPELAQLHRHVNRRCILDGELAVIRQGKPDFFAIQRRSLTSSPVKIQLAAQQHPATLVVFDMLYLDDHATNDLPLMERKKLLQETITGEDARFAVSRYIEGSGTAFYELTKAQNLEGIVAKRRESRYYFGKRTKDWIKVKYLKDEDFVVCGYIRKQESMNSIVLGQYQSGKLVYKGHVSLGVSGASFRKIQQQPRLSAPPFPEFTEAEPVTWVEPQLVCTVQYMMKTESGGMRQPVFKGLRDDKSPKECIEGAPPS
jgi:bifunctional non-homologous end joining protein LigD/DNA ligase-1